MRTAAPERAAEIAMGECEIRQRCPIVLLLDEGILLDELTPSARRTTAGGAWRR
jgi:hypothetical protein